MYIIDCHGNEIVFSTLSPDQQSRVIQGTGNIFPAMLDAIVQKPEDTTSVETIKQAAKLRNEATEYIKEYKYFSNNIDYLIHAISCYEKAKELNSQKFVDNYTIAKTYELLGEHYIDILKEINLAREQYKRAAYYYLNILSFSKAAECWTKYSTINDEEFEGLQEQLNKALEFIKLQNHSDPSIYLELCNSYIEVGVIYQLLSKTSQMHEAFSQAFYISQGPINYDAYRIEQSTYGISSKEPIGTDNLVTCITIIIWDPKTKKSGMAHLDHTNLADKKMMDFLSNFPGPDATNPDMGYKALVLGCTVEYDQTIENNVRELVNQFFMGYNYIKIKQEDIHLNTTINVTKDIPSGIIFYPDNYIDYKGGLHEAGSWELGVPGKFDDTTYLRKQIYKYHSLVKIFDFSQGNYDIYVPKFTKDEIADILKYAIKQEILFGHAIWSSNIYNYPAIKTIEYVLKNEENIPIIIECFKNQYQEELVNVPDNIKVIIDNYLVNGFKNIITHHVKFSDAIEEINEFDISVLSLINKNFTDQIFFLKIVDFYNYIKKSEDKMDSLSKDWFEKTENELIKFFANVIITEEDGKIKIGGNNINELKINEIKIISNFFDSIESKIDHEKASKIDDFIHRWVEIKKALSTLKFSEFIKEINMTNKETFSLFTNSLRSILNEEGIDSEIVNRYMDPDIISDSKKVLITFEQIKENEGKYNIYIHDIESDTIHKLTINSDQHEIINYINEYNKIMREKIPLLYKE